MKQSRSGRRRATAVSRGQRVTSRASVQRGGPTLVDYSSRFIHFLLVTK